ncbi:hypothetical protein BDV30DRAFT_203137 [Aspergillus minisclerotigenes]|uniref:Uncharacterized protein n=1 Tax=Aspergillus minisclerotigenes TaxID=656917 RepID=A0A5N6JI00_9EURO|nr:hypothetical protein BDV30DRAFT_203137 [Aspergillus minisclerotigenes]
MRQMSRQAHNPFHESNSPQDEPCSLCASLMGSADVLARDFSRHRWAQQWFDRKETHFKITPGPRKHVQGFFIRSVPPVQVHVRGHSVWCADI